MFDRSMLCALLAWPVVALATGPVAAPPPSTVRTLEPDVLFEKVAPSVWGVVAIASDGGQSALGSAVVVAPGRLVTNCHVVEKAKTLWVRHENMMFGADLELRDAERDLCQLKVANFTAPAVEILAVDQVRVGGKAYAIGNPRGLENTLSDGLVSAVRRTKEGAVEALQTTAPISAGSSGGGLFDAQGRLLGITTFSLRDSQNLNFALPASWILEMKDRVDKRGSVLANASAGAPNVAARQVATGGEGYAPRPGDSFDYKLTDLTTGTSRSVRYRVQRVEGSRVVFNEGDRVETLDGELLINNQAVGGLFDEAAPPGGWWRRNPQDLQRWSLRYNGTSSIATSYEIRADVVGKVTLHVAGHDLPAVLCQYRGYLTRSSPGLNRGTFNARLWYSEDLKRPLRFEVEGRAQSYIVHERLELERLPGE
jgi:S1-C subfamily serine protease